MSSSSRAVASVSAAFCAKITTPAKPCRSSIAATSSFSSARFWRLPSASFHQRNAGMSIWLIFSSVVMVLSMAALLFSAAFAAGRTPIVRQSVSSTLMIRFTCFKMNLLAYFCHFLIVQ